MADPDWLRHSALGLLVKMRKLGYCAHAWRRFPPLCTREIFVSALFIVCKKDLNPSPGNKTIVNHCSSRTTSENAASFSFVKNECAEREKGDLVMRPCVKSLGPRGISRVPDISHSENSHSENSHWKSPTRQTPI